MALLLTPVVLYYASHWSRDGQYLGAAGTAADAATAIPEKSIAVLPFVDMSEKKDQEYFSDGLAEELLDLLSQVPDLRVPARTSSFYFKGRSDDIASIAQKLRVKHVLEGNVRRSGERIRVTAQLIRADNGYHLWSKTYDRDAKDVFQVQDEIANAVVTALKAQLLNTPQLTDAHRTSSTQAYTAYLMGNQLRDTDTAESNAQALRYYQRAVELDPNYADAYSGIADAEWRLADMVSGEAQGYERSLQAATRAIELAPAAAEGYVARGNLRMAYSYDWSGAEADLKKALELDPRNVAALRNRALLLAARGDGALALELLQQSVALDPLSVGAWRTLIELQRDVGQLGAAAASVAHLQSVAPQNWATHAAAGQIALFGGRFPEAMSQFREGGPAWRLIGTGMAQCSLGDRSAAQQSLDQLTATYARTLAYQIAQAYAWCAEPAQALTWLERAYGQHDGGLIYLPHDAYFAPLRAEPRYQALLKKLRFGS